MMKSNDPLLKKYLYKYIDLSFHFKAPSGKIITTDKYTFVVDILLDESRTYPLNITHIQVNCEHSYAHISSYKRIKLPRILSDVEALRIKLLYNFNEEYWINRYEN